VCGTWDLPHSLIAVCEKRITRGMTKKSNLAKSPLTCVCNFHGKKMELLDAIPMVVEGWGASREAEQKTSSSSDRAARGAKHQLLLKHPAG
jgi:hypothetical protein